MSILDLITSFLAPHTCVGCGTEGAVLCPACVALLPKIPTRCYRCNAVTEMHRTCRSCRRQSQLVYVWPATTYETAAKAAVHRLKYERARAAADCLALAMAMRLPSLPLSSWVIVHAPTVPARVRVRGYDQAQLVARALGRSLHFPVAAALVRQTNQRQVGQSGVTRRKQMAGAFGVDQPSVVKNKDILLIDDVLTTGATLEAAAAALRQAGARRVAAAVFAQA